MSRSDDLAPLVAPTLSGQGVSFRQGVILFWDQDTAENLVQVGSRVLENLPILNTSEAAILAEGDVVGILTAGATWGILGRFTIPGTPQAVSALSSLRTASESVLNNESTTSTSMTDLATVGPSVEVAVGPSGRALVIVSAEWTGVTETGVGISTGGGRMGYEATGANTLPAITRYSASSSIRHAFSSAPAGVNFELMTGISRVTLRTGLTPGLTTFTAKYQSFVGVVPTSFRDRNITVMAL